MFISFSKYDNSYQYNVILVFFICSVCLSVALSGVNICNRILSLIFDTIFSIIFVLDYSQWSHFALKVAFSQNFQENFLCLFFSEASIIIIIDYSHIRTNNQLVYEKSLWILLSSLKLLFFQRATWILSSKTFSKIDCLQIQYSLFAILYFLN